MIEFWLSAGLLLLAALSFLLIPILRGRRRQQEEDRTALNVALYQERVAELAAQQAAGVLDDAQLAKGQPQYGSCKPPLHGLASSTKPWYSGASCSRQTLASTMPTCL